MSERPRILERHCDVAVVGGSAAGLAAALQLSRQRRSVIVVDAGDPRNAPAFHMHGYLGHEAVSPRELIRIGREEVRAYGGEILDGRVVDIVRTDGDGGFRLSLTGGHAIVARRVLAATGLRDELPEIPGLAPHWGRDVIHCPFCHGYEFRDRRVVQIVTHPIGLHTAGLFRQLTSRLAVVLHQRPDDSSAELARLDAAGADIIDQRVREVIAGANGRVAAVELADGRLLAADAVVITPRFAARVEAFASIGLGTLAHPIGLGDVVETDLSGATAVDGVYAAGNATDPSQQVLHAAAHGSRVGAMISADLADDDLRVAARSPANEADWDHRYGGQRMWSGNPNGSLVHEASHLAPGRALDVGAGEGGDALWLAERGWAVTANDVSARPLESLAAEATRRGLAVECLHADANAPDPFEPAAFDLVTAMYASIPRTPDRRAIHNLLDAVAPGGTLLVVGHDLEPMRAPIDTSSHSRAFDPDAYVRVDDVAAHIGVSPGWHIEINEKRPRPTGAASASHHVDDIVLRARRAKCPRSADHP